MSEDNEKSVVSLNADNVEHFRQDSEGSVDKEFEWRDVPCDRHPANHHEAVVAVDKWINQAENKEFKADFEFTVEFQKADTDNVFSAKFRNKKFPYRDINVEPVSTDKKLQIEVDDEPSVTSHQKQGENFNQRTTYD